MGNLIFHKEFDAKENSSKESEIMQYVWMECKVEFE